MQEFDRDVLMEADRLLEHWWRYESAYYPAVWFPARSPYCKQGRSTRQWETTDDIADEAWWNSVRKKIEEAVYAISAPSRVAIMVEMRCRVAKAKVWRQGETPVVPYWMAVREVTPLLVERSVIDL